MISMNLKARLQILGVLIVFLSIGSVQANCQYYETSLPKLIDEKASLDSSSHFIEAILKGDTQTQKLSSKNSLVSLFKVPLDNEAKVASAIQQLQTQLESLTEPLPMSDELAVCGGQGQRWLSLSNQKRQAEVNLLKQKILFLSQTPSKRVTLAKQISAWKKVESVAGAIRLSQSQYVQQEDVTLELAQLEAWVIEYQNTFSTWLSLYVGNEADFSFIDKTWLSTLALPAPEDELNEQNAAILQITDAPDWLYVLSESRLSLFKDVSRWRNQALLNQGWFTFFSQLISPSVFFEGLFKEVISAPKNFLDNLSRPFIKEYKLAAKEDKQTALLLAWVSQVLALILLSFILIKMAGGATSWLAKRHQILITKIDRPALYSLVSGFFWLLKPNASWLFLLIAANSIVLVFQDDWQILSLIAPLGTIYAFFRGLRIIIEWGLSRIHTRSDIFLSSQAGEQLVRDSQKIARVILGGALFWWLALGTGGGYSFYLISLVDLVIFWLVCLWLLTKYKQPVDKLTEMVLRKKISGDQADIGWVLKLMLKIAWPLVFLFVHIVDVFSSLNQKLMVFDIYRSLSVKLLRVRLESRSEEAVEEDETEPDQSYTSWMLREMSDDLVFDIGDASGILEPINKWFMDKTDENITVVVGEPGSGKSTLIRRLPKIWDQTPVKVLDVSNKLTDAQGFYQKISELLGIELVTDAGGLVKQDKDIERQVVVIDSAHNLFMAEVGCFKAYRALMECMNAHLENVYWVVVFNTPSWTYLNYVFSREQRVSSVYKMPRWSPLDIRKLILSRHKGGKRRLKYNNLLLSAAASSESSSIKAADSRVFNILWEQSGGNPLAAIELWLDAVKVKGRLAEVGVPERPSANLLNGMKDDLYFVYTAIVLHASLSTAEIMLVTHFSEPIVRHAVKQGLNMGMIIRDGSRRYKIDPYWYGTLSGFLHRKNLLWN